MELWYMNNVCRRLVCRINVEDISLDIGCELKDYILHIYQENGYQDALNADKLFASNENGERIPFYDISSIQKAERIEYLSIIAPNNAYEYKRQDGILYFFHTSEGKHMEYPHIHARCGREEISVYFSDFHVIGKMMPPKRRQAVRYVKEHIEDMKEKWDTKVKGK